MSFIQIYMYILKGHNILTVFFSSSCFPCEWKSITNLLDCRLQYFLLYLPLIFGNTKVLKLVKNKDGVLCFFNSTLSEKFFLSLSLFYIITLVMNLKLIMVFQHHFTKYFAIFCKTNVFNQWIEMHHVFNGKGLRFKPYDNYITSYNENLCLKL